MTVRADRKNVSTTGVGGLCLSLWIATGRRCEYSSASACNPQRSAPWRPVIERRSVGLIGTSARTTR
jgi:hypothetical protein